MRWLASWLLIRGCDMLVPHAFYYSLRGPRRHERPPNVGPGSPWWGADYTRWEAMTRRLCWLNATCLPVCDVAILGSSPRLPWLAAKACFENQIDFHYVEPADLQNARVENGNLHIGQACYKVLIVEPSYEAEAVSIPQGASVLRWDNELAIRDLLALASPSIKLDASTPGLRARLLRTAPDADAPWLKATEAVSASVTHNKNNNTANTRHQDILLLFNESEDTIHCQAFLNGLRLNPEGGSSIETVTDGICKLQIPPHDWIVFLLS